MRALHPFGRVGRPEEVAAAVSCLLSAEASFINAEASFINGAILPVDGGRSALGPDPEAPDPATGGAARRQLATRQHHWSKLGLTLSADDFTDAEAIAAVVRITSGNFRLVQRLFAQAQRIMEINNLSTVTKEVIETARESLVIGSL